MKLKQAQLSQLKEIELLYKQCAKIPNSSWNDDYPSWDFLWQDFLDHNLYVLMQQDQILGVVSLLELTADILWPVTSHNLKTCCRLAINPAYHRLGYGRILCQLLIEEAIKQHLDGLVLLVAKQNEVAIKLYQSLHFEIVTEALEYGIDFWGLYLDLSQEMKEGSHEKTNKF